MVLFLNSFRLYSFLGSFTTRPNLPPLTVLPVAVRLLVFAALQAYPLSLFMSTTLFISILTLVESREDIKPRPSLFRSGHARFRASGSRYSRVLSLAHVGVIVAAYMYCDKI
jgi:hypothetical protein